MLARKIICSVGVEDLSSYVYEDSADLALMMAMASLTVGNLLTNDLGFFFFFGGVFCEGNSLSAFHLKISGPADFFPPLK